MRRLTLQPAWRNTVAPSCTVGTTNDPADKTRPLKSQTTQVIQSEIDELKKTLAAQPQAKQRSRGTSSAPAGAGDSLDAELAALGDSDVDDGGDDNDDDDDLGDLDDDDDMDEETKVRSAVIERNALGEKFRPSSERSSRRR